MSLLLLFLRLWCPSSLLSRRFGAFLLFLFFYRDGRSAPPILFGILQASMTLRDVLATPFWQHTGSQNPKIGQGENDRAII